jgi:hypothetical protein
VAARRLADLVGEGGLVVTRERRRRLGVVAGLSTVAAVLVLVVAVLVISRDGKDAPEAIGPTPTTPDRTKATTEPEPIPRGRPEVLVRQLGGQRLEVAGEIVPGKWGVENSRRDVWAGAYVDEVGYWSPALWWGKGTATHEVPGQRGGVAISQDAHWIAWTRTVSGGYSDPSRPWVMEVVDTAPARSAGAATPTRMLPSSRPWR